MKRFPSLDGLRAISILLVIAGHIGGTSAAPGLFTFLERYANLGVRIFFVISGYLITTLLLREAACTGHISLRDFYVRRAYRIFPAAYAYMAVAFVFFGSHLRPFDVAMSLTYTVNYNLSRPWEIAHMWSLGVEEQFYLLWPAVLALFFRWRIRLLLWTIAATPFLNCFLYYIGWKKAVGNYFPTIADAIATGCLAAILASRLSGTGFLKSRWMLILAPAVVLIAGAPVHGTLQASVATILGRPLTHVGIALFMLHAIEKKYYVLNAAPVIWLGGISYSLYLWQQPFLNRHSSSLLCAFPLNVLCALVVASLSYYAVERPLLRIRDARSRKRAGAGIWRGPNTLWLEPPHSEPDKLSLKISQV